MATSEIAQGKSKLLDVSHDVCQDLRQQNRRLCLALATVINKTHKDFQPDPATFRDGPAGTVHDSGDLPVVAW